MSKVICNVCGTSYPDNATQCPICGCVRDTLAQSVPAESPGKNAGASGYTYVKGGRFSKSNVRKRTGGTVSASGASGHGRDGENSGLVITAIVLFLAIIAVAIFITVKLLAPSTDPADQAAENNGTEQTDETSVEILCEDISFDAEELTLDKQGMVEKLVVTINPEGCTEELGAVVSEDPTVATAVMDGTTVTITAVGPGETTIKLRCGEKVATCKVICDFKELKIPEEIVLTKAGQTKDIYPDDILRTDITWESADKEIATVDLGTVTAVAKGETVIRATYKGQTVECVVKCDFSEDKNDESEEKDDENHNNVINGTGSVTEDGGSSGGSYMLKNLYGTNNEEISLSINEEAPFVLVDGNGNRVSGVTWSSSNSDCCTVVDGMITAKSSGSVTITATYNGQSYTCSVLVW